MLIEMWARLFHMYTILNLCFVVVHRWMPEWIQDIIRASTALILVVVATSVWFSGNVTTIYGELFDSFIPHSTLSHTAKIAIVAMGDGLFHIVPHLVIGMPRVATSFIWAYGIMLVWYSTVRNNIKEIYSPSVPADRGIVVAGVVTALASAARLMIC
jgi:hypothetical protein